ncbi:TPA: outer membrane protein transport protein [Haemophilus influenzae]
MKKFNQSLLATAMLLAAGGANAAAFQLAEVSTSGLGRAYAGEAAIADNASVVATNPALMSLFKTAQFSNWRKFLLLGLVVPMQVKRRLQIMLLSWQLTQL